MKFQDFKYERPDVEVAKGEIEGLISEFNQASDADIQVSIIDKINKIRNDVETMMSICHVRHTINTTDEFYDAENQHMDEIQPIFQGVETDYYKALISSKFRSELEEKVGTVLFDLAEIAIKTFSEEVLADLQEENKLGTSYQKLIASAKIQYDGEEKNLSQMTPYMTSKDRDVRKEANELYYGFLADNVEELDSIYDKLVKLRAKIADKLGFESFVELGYARMQRLDYNKGMVENFRNQVKDVIVPLAVKLREKQKKRLGLDALKYYDLGFGFASGNAIPKGDPDWIVDQGVNMYNELSPETKDFFQMMKDRELLDLVAKKGKAGGGYCTHFPNYKVPFIFSNFNGTLGDITVLTHEVGHAFQCYLSMGYDVPEYIWPTSEACEIHSMGMEFMTYPWMDNFFEEEADKFRYGHLEDAIQFIPYGVSVDEFQHFVYENPEATPEQRRAQWREIEKKYTPYKEFEGNEYLESGGLWQKQLHIYMIPFYYIDYTLAQICALQFFKKSMENREAAWTDYLNLCKAGGSKSFLKLVDLANLNSPFADGTVKDVVDSIEAYLNSIDDSKF